jgi:hypothetical protein
MLKNFQEFYESLNILVVRDLRDIYDALIADFKKRNPKGSVAEDNMPYPYVAVGDYTCVINPYKKTKVLSGVFFMMTKDIDGKINGLLLFSEFGPITQEEIDNILPKEITGSLKNEKIAFSRKILKDHAYDRGNLEVSSKDMGRGAYRVERYYYVLATYEESQRDKTEISLEQIMNLPDYKKLIEETGMEMISTPVQKKNLTITFGFPAALTAPLAGEGNGYFYERQISNRDGKTFDYLKDGFALYARGQLRKIPTFSDPGDRPALIGKFEGSSLQGWADGLDTLREKILKHQSDLKKRMDLYLTPEEKHKNRGKISGRKFGI